MTESLCDFLDDFLADDLPSERTFRFVEHLNDCEGCRSATQDWRSLRQTLKLATHELNVPSAALLQRIMPPATIAAAAQEPHRSKQLATLAAGLFLLGTAGWLTLSDPEKNEPRRVTQTVTTTVEVPPPELSQPVVNVTSPEDVIGVPIDIGDPNVVVVWVYPTIPMGHRDSTTSKMLPFFSNDVRSNP